MMRRVVSSQTKQVVRSTKRSFSNSAAKNVGIAASDIYFPKRFVKQSELEKYDKIDAGRYTIGLGQTEMSFCGPEEDITSMCMNAINQLMTKYNIKHKDIGFLGVGTETLIDKSKSTKTALMKSFQENGNTDIEGVTCINACYGGTAALFHCFDWMESSAWDGRLGIVLAGDIAVYAKGNARPTGGAGVVAMLVGPDAPIVMERGIRASHFEDVYDFYKPNMLSEYPLVDGQLSNTCYIRSIDKCFQLYAKKFTDKMGLGQFDLDKHVQHSVFHLPYTKLVQKSFARFAYNSHLLNPANPKYSSLKPLIEAVPDLEASYSDKNLEKAMLAISKKDYEQKVFPSTFAGRSIGNMYAGSLYGGLLSLIAAHGDNLVGQRALMFSYGSGLAASMYSLSFRSSVEEQRSKCDLFQRLKDRTECSAEEFSQAMMAREAFSMGDKSVASSFLETVNQKQTLYPGSAYLTGVDKLMRRTYAHMPSATTATTAKVAASTTTTQQQKVSVVAEKKPAQQIPRIPYPAAQQPRQEAFA